MSDAKIILISQLLGLTREALAAPNVAERWLERMDELLIHRDLSEYAEYQAQDSYTGFDLDLVLERVRTMVNEQSCAFQPDMEVLRIIERTLKAGPAPKKEIR